MLRKSVLAVMGILIWCTESPAEELSAVYRNVRNAVVVINTRESIRMPVPGKEEISYEGLGSGVLISDDGKILTASHVVHTADEVMVIFADGDMIPAKVISSMPMTDLALVQLQRMPAQPTVVPLADSDSANVGDRIFVIGAPYGISHSLTVGYISGRRKDPSMPGGLSELELIQTDAAVNQGNSGGPMFNLNGEVIGIVSYILSRSGGFEGIGFAVTSNLARKVMLERPFFWGGVESLMLENELAAVFNIPQDAGLLIQRVAHGSVAHRMGLRGGFIPIGIGEQEFLAGGDIILKVAGIQVSRANIFKMQEQIDGIPQDGTLSVTYLRGGKVREVTTRKE